jgi:periplasmic protein CpxP/Spy
MKRRIWMLAISALTMMALSAFGQAQEGQGQGGGQGRGRGMMASPEERVNRLSQELNLTDDQKTKIKAIYQDQADKGAKLREDTSLSQDDRRAKMMDMQKDTSEKIKAVLDKDQQKKFDEMQERMRQRGPGGAGAGAAKPEGAQKPPQQ